MTEQELRDIWRGNSETHYIRLDKELLVNDLSRKMARWDGGIRKRNTLETTAAIIVMCMFIIAGLMLPPLLTKIAAFLLAGWSLLVIVVLRKVKKMMSIDEAKSVLQYLQAYRDYILKEHWILKNVLVWYIVPPTIFIVMFLAGMGLTVPKLVFSIAATLLVNALVYRINKQAVKDEVEPMLNRLESAIKELEE